MHQGISHHRLSVALLAGLVLCTSSFYGIVAQAQTQNTRPTVLVYPHAKINQGTIYLGEIAKIDKKNSSHSNLVSKLAEIQLGSAPAPASATQLLGSEILAAIEKAGFSPALFAYSIPQTVTIHRAGRALTKDEVLTAAQRISFSKPSLDVRVRDISWPNEQVIPTGKVNFQMEALATPSTGKLPLRVKVFVNEQLATRFLATAVVDHWAQVPVVTRTLERGLLINPEDVQLVRMNIATAPPDIVRDKNHVVGHRVRSRIAAGTTIRERLVELPPTIGRGDPLTIIYKLGGIHATATGHAISAGQTGETIQVKNSSSKRILRAKIIQPRLVEVERQ